MIPADAVINRLLASPTITEITRVMWAGGLADPREIPALIVQVAERPAYPSVEASFLDTRADLTIVALASTYQGAYELAGAARAVLHGYTLDESGISIGPITWDRLDNSSVADYGQAIVYQVPQVFTCNIRRA